MWDFLKALGGGIIALACFYVLVWAMYLTGPANGMALR